MDEQPSPQGEAGEPKATIRDRAAALRERAKVLEARAQERLAVEQGKRGWIRLLIDSYDADRNRGGALLAGGLAYRIFLWELPAALFVVSLMNVVSRLVGEEASVTVQRSGVAATIANTVAEAVAQTDTYAWWLMIVGATVALWAGRGAVRALWLICEIAWQERGVRPSAVKASLAFSGIMLGAITLPFVLALLLRGFLVLDIVHWAISSVLLAGLCVLGVTLLPRGGRPWTAILPGAVGFLVTLRFIMLGSGIYLSTRMDNVDLYGAFGLAIVIMLWLYIVARMFVGAMFVNATFSGVPPGRLGGELGVRMEQTAQSTADGSSLASPAEEGP